MFAKYFTPYEATCALPEIRGIVEEILDKGQRMIKLSEDISTDIDREEEVKIQNKIAELMGELETRGCFFKDWNFEIGLVDFPSMIHGREVFLCWKSDESKLRWYHPIEEGFSGRKLIPEDLLDEELLAQDKEGGAI